MELTAEEEKKDSKKADWYELYDITDIEGIGPKYQKMLNSIGIFSVPDLLNADVEKITILGKVKKEVAIALVLSGHKFVQDNKEFLEEFSDANDVLEKRKDVLKIRTGSKDLDNLLFGGIETGSLTEFYGQFGSGKSQICHTLCVNATLPIAHKGADSCSIYLDTEGTFRPERIDEICTHMGLNPVDIKSKIKYCKIINSSHLELKVQQLNEPIEKFKPKVIIIDSIIALHKAEYIGRGMLAERQQRLHPMLRHLTKLAETYNLAVVVTNQVIANPNASFGADPIVASGGNIMAHISTYRIYLKRFSKYRTARMIDSPYHPYSDTKFKVTERGIEDLSDKEKSGGDNTTEEAEKEDNEE